jgi:sec-independent protein translocase protein TatA
VFSQVGWPELLIVLVIVVLLFGPKRLPALGRQLGHGLREFKDSVTGERHPDGDDDGDGEDESPKRLPQPEESSQAAERAHADAPSDPRA